MKVPGADYTQIRQAQQARTNAMVGAYAAKDASHAKNRYDIQKESIDNSRTANNVNLVLGIANIGVNLAQNLYADYKQEKDKEQKNRYSNAWDVYNARGLEKVAEYGKDAFQEDGDTLSMNPELDNELNEIFDEVFGTSDDWDKDYWDFISSNKTVFMSGLRTQALTLHNQAQAEANATAFGENMAKLMTDAVQNYFTGSTENVSVPDGKGDSWTYELPTTLKTAIDAYYPNEADRLNAYAKYAKEFQSKRGQYLLDSAVEFYRKGMFTGNEELVESMTDELMEHADKITDKAEREAYIENARTSITNGVYEWYNNEVASISSFGGEARYDMAEVIQALLGEVEEGKSTVFVTPTGESIEIGSWAKIFTGKDGKANPFIEADTLTTLRQNIASNLKTIETEWGTEKTAAVQSAILQADADFTAQKINAMEWGTKVKLALASAYGNDWASIPEAQNVFYNAIKSAIPEDLSKNEPFMTQLNMACNNLWKDDFAKLTGQNKADALILRTNMYNDLLQEVLVNPEIVKDPVAMTKTVKDIADNYTAQYFDTIHEDYSIGFWESLVDSSGFESVGKTIGDLLNNGILDEIKAQGLVSEAGVLDIASANLKPGEKDALNNGITTIGQYMVDKGIPVASPAGGSIVMNEDGATVHGIMYNIQDGFNFGGLDLSGYMIMVYLDGTENGGSNWEMVNVAGTKNPANPEHPDAPSEVISIPKKQVTSVDGMVVPAPDVLETSGAKMEEEGHVVMGLGINSATPVKGTVGTPGTNFVTVGDMKVTKFNSSTINESTVDGVRNTQTLDYVYERALDDLGDGATPMDIYKVLITSAKNSTDLDSTWTYVKNKIGSNTKLISDLEKEVDKQRKSFSKV